MKKGNKLAIAALAGVMAVGIAASTFAYFAKTSTFNNELETGTYGSTIEEKFTPPTNWVPGAEVEKSVIVSNTGDVNLVVRVQLTDSWASGKDNFISYDKDGDDTVAEGEGDYAAILNFNADVETEMKTLDTLTGNESGWVLVQDGTERYYYYFGIVGAGQSTPELLNSVTLNSILSATEINESVTKKIIKQDEVISVEDYNNLTVAVPEGSTQTADELKAAAFTAEVIEGTETITGYKANSAITVTVTTKTESGTFGFDGDRFTLTVTAETVQADEAAILEEFGDTDVVRAFIAALGLATPVVPQP